VESMRPSPELLRLSEEIASMRKAMVAFSGGVDSAVVVAAALSTLGPDRVVAVTSVSQSLSKRELNDCLHVARKLGVRHELVHTNELALEGYRRNQGDRCYHCKGELYRTLESLPGFTTGFVLVNGANADDIGDWRPGMKAAKEAGVRSPLLDCGFGKATVRALARELALDIAEKPSSPCLASRIPYDRQVTALALSQIEWAEDFLKSEGFQDVRVRHYGSTARIEVPSHQIELLTASVVLNRIRQQLARFGFSDVEVDLEGLVSGKLNRSLAHQTRSVETI
jgi:pyridinium-3,5-biscarboxylic acid mononucleotide sulfurtransferase